MELGHSWQALAVRSKIFDRLRGANSAVNLRVEPPNESANMLYHNWFRIFMSKAEPGNDASAVFETDQYVNASRQASFQAQFS